MMRNVIPQNFALHRTVACLLCAILALVLRAKQRQNASRHVSSEEQSISTSERKLDWIFIQKTIPDDHYYTFYNENYIPDNVYQQNDRRDYLRLTDVCPNSADWSYKRENCPIPPDCSEIKQIWGPAKLCINRVPLPFDVNSFYVAAMKCIPVWENCDKCMCGQITGEGHTDHCIFIARDDPNDDTVQVDCYELDLFKMIDNVFLPFDPKNPPTVTPTTPPSSSPSVIPSSLPTAKPSFSPTLTLLPSNDPSYNPSAAPTEAPSRSPTDPRPSSSPTPGPSSYPTSTRDPSVSPSVAPFLKATTTPSLARPTSYGPSSSPNARITVNKGTLKASYEEPAIAAESYSLNSSNGSKATQLCMPVSVMITLLTGISCAAAFISRQN